MALRAAIDAGVFAWPNHATLPLPSLPPAPPATVTMLRFALPRTAPSTLLVVDAEGHMMRTLYSGVLAAGEHACGWDGLDDGHTPAPPGEYTLLLEVEDRLIAARLVTIG